ncbi:hypothetical protein BS50DRAFT_88067 [Corynespora cassiicola Philippines]|uniref:MARVEL domain-containing protein n=1 Tax=Corynespora cassiicola Philippines TaxID=1448308 RepID=A0A2T2NE91_CORCC|nr:hypothetical protein BS50DRAFT_88067 [Corynespora cassiicola Philippines]
MPTRRSRNCHVAHFVHEHCSPPRDTRWRNGIYPRFLVGFCTKTIFLLIFIFLIVGDLVLLNELWPSKHNANEPFSFFFRIGIALFPDLLFTIITIVCIYTGKLHPVTSLVVSIFGFGLYPVACFFNIITVYSNEYPFDGRESWYALGYAEAAFQAILALFYLALMVVSAIAVHRWRKLKRTSQNDGWNDLENMRKSLDQSGRSSDATADSKATF